MSNGPIKISNLTLTSSFSNADLLVIVQNTGTTLNTFSINPSTLLAGVFNNTSPTFQGNLAVSNTLTVGNSTVNTVIGWNSTDLSLVEFVGNQNNYIQGIIWNSNNQSSASADFAVYDNNGPIGNNYVDIGILSSGWSNTLWTISNPSDAYLYSGNTNLSIGVASVGGGTNYINFFTGGSLSTNERMRIDAGGNVNIGNVTSTATFTVGNTSAAGSKFTANSIQYSVGNSTVNTFSNSTHFYSGNSTSYGFGNSTAEALVTANSSGNISVYIITSSSANVGNSTVYGFGNSTVEGLYNTTTNTSAVLSASNLSIGNSTSNVVINSTTISIGSSSISQNGWSTMSNGLKMQWGQANANSSTAAINFPNTTLFSVNVYSITATSNSTPGAAAANVPYIFAVNNSTFTIRTTSATNNYVFWMAIGS